MCSLSHLKCQRFCNRMLFLCHKYQRGKHGAIPQESNDSKTQLHCPSKPSVRDCVHLRKLGEQTRVLFCRLKEHTAFFPLNGVSWTTKNENSFRASFVVCFQHFPNTSEGSFPFLQFNTCVILLRGSDVVYRWEFIDCRRAPQDPYIVKTL